MAIDWRGFVIAELAPERIAALYATRVRVSGGWLVELAGTGDPLPLVPTLLPAGDRVEAIDAARGDARCAMLSEGRLKAALFLSKSGRLPSRDWLVAQLVVAEPGSTAELLAGRARGAASDAGPLVCACFEVGSRAIIRAIAEHRLVSVAEVGAALRAGTNCGSCRPAIRALVEAGQERAHG